MTRDRHDSALHYHRQLIRQKFVQSCAGRWLGRCATTREVDLGHPRNAAKDTYETSLLWEPDLHTRHPPEDGHRVGCKRLGAPVLITVNCMPPLNHRVRWGRETPPPHRMAQERGSILRTGISLGVTEVIPMAEEDPHVTG